MLRVVFPKNALILECIQRPNVNDIPTIKFVFLEKILQPTNKEKRLFCNPEGSYAVHCYFSSTTAVSVSAVFFVEQSKFQYFTVLSTVSSRILPTLISCFNTKICFFRANGCSLHYTCSILLFNNVIRSF